MSSSFSLGTVLLDEEEDDVGELGPLPDVVPTPDAISVNSSSGGTLPPGKKSFPVIFLYKF